MKILLSNPFPRSQASAWERACPQSSSFVIFRTQRKLQVSNQAHFQAGFKKHSNIRNSESGMLLLEVMLAVLIFSLAAVSLAVALNESLDAFADIRRQSEVRLQLQSALAEATGQKVSVGKEKLQLGSDTVVYTRDVTLLDWQNEKKEPVSNMYQVTIRAEWQEGERTVQREATQYVFQN